MFEIIILSLLLLATYCDIKSRAVPNGITMLIAFLAILSINIQSLSIPHVLIIFSTLFQYGVNVLGKADVIVILPLVLSFSLVALWIWVIAVCLIATLLILRYKHVQPMFIAITVGFLLTLLV